MSTILHFMTRLAAGVAGLALAAAAASSAAAAAPAPNGGPGNSGAAHACQHGGYAALAREESPSVAFTGQGACVSYAAHGGAIVPLGPSIRLTFTVVPGSASSCAVQAYYYGLTPNATIGLGFAVRSSGIYIGGIAEVTTDSVGYATVSFGKWPSGWQVKASASGASTGWLDVAC